MFGFDLVNVNIFLEIFHLILASLVLNPIIVKLVTNPHASRVLLIEGRYMNKLSFQSINFSKPIIEIIISPIKKI